MQSSSKLQKDINVSLIEMNEGQKRRRKKEEEEKRNLFFWWIKCRYNFQNNFINIFIYKLLGKKKKKKKKIL